VVVATLSVAPRKKSAEMLVLKFHFEALHFNKKTS